MKNVEAGSIITVRTPALSPSHQEKEGEVRTHRPGVRANIAWYAAPRFIFRGMDFLLLAIYTRLLAPGEFGQAMVALAVAGIAGLVVAPGMEGVYLRWICRQKGSVVSAEQGLGTLFALHLGFLVVSLGVLVLFGKSVAAFFLSGIPAWPFYYAAVATVGLVSLGAPLRASWRAQHRADKIAVLELVQSAISMCAILSALLVFRWGAISLLLGDLVANVVLLPLYLSAAIPSLREEWRPEILREAAPLAFAGLPVVLSTWALSTLDRIFLNRMSGSVEAGFYGVGYQVAAAVMMIQIILHKEWQPLVLDMMRGSLQVQEMKVLQQLWDRSLLLFLVLGSVVALFSADIVHWILGKRYLASATITPLVVLIAVLQVPYAFLLDVGLAHAKAHALTLVSFLTVGVFAVGNLLLIPRFGGQGAALAGVMAYSVGCVFLFCRKWNVFQVDRRLASWSALCGGSVLLGSIMGGTVVCWGVGVIAAAILAYQAVAYWQFLGSLHPARDET